MPVISFKLWDLDRLVRHEVPRDKEKLEELLSVMKMELESIENNEVTVEVAHDRADLFSAEGIGRFLRFYHNVEEPSKYVITVSKEASLDISKAPSYRPYAFMVIVRNVKLDDEAIRQLFQLQEKLHLSHCGDRSLVSIGLYDLDKLKPPFKYASTSDYRFIPLEETKAMNIEEILKETDKGRRYAHLVKKGEYPILIDSEGKVLSFPPIINSEETKVTEDTRNIVIDVTGPEPYLMAKVISVVALSTLERTYGSRNIEVVPIEGNQELTNILLEVINGRELGVGLSSIKNLLGINLGINDVVKLLKKLGYVIEDVSSDSVKVWVPPYRLDVIDGVDVIEDLAIGFGYGNIEPELMPPTHTGAIDPIERFANVVRDVMIGLGYTEVVNFIMIDKDYLKLVSNEAFIEVANPKLKSYSALRNSLIPSLLLTVKVNKELYPIIKVFEVGDVVKVLGNEPVTLRYLGFVISKPDATLTDALATLKTLLSNLGIKYRLERLELEPLLLRGRSAKVVTGNSEVGVIGEVHPEILTRLEIHKPVVVCELCINSLYEIILKEPVLK